METKVPGPPDNGETPLMRILSTHTPAVGSQKPLAHCVLLVQAEPAQRPHSPPQAGGPALISPKSACKLLSKQCWGNKLTFVLVLLLNAAQSNPVAPKLCRPLAMPTVGQFRVTEPDFWQPATV